MHYDNNEFEMPFHREESLNTYVSKVFGWMFLGLIVTAITAFFTATSETILTVILSNRFTFFGLFIAEFAVVIYLSSRITKMNYSSAIGAFIFYAILNGITFSIILLVYTSSSIALTFMIAATTFGVMSLYGYITKTDLTRFRNMLFMGLIGLIILSVINLFLKSSSIEWAVSIIGLFVFLGLTAYDTQAIKQYYYSTENNLELRKKIAIMGALRLYLDFINLFLTLLRIFGRRR